MRVHPNPNRTVNGNPLQVRDPGRGDILPPEGRHVPRDTYWLRRLSAGDVLEGIPAPVTQGVDVQADGVEYGPITAHGDHSAAPVIEPVDENQVDDSNSVDDNAAELPQNEPEISDAEKPAKASKARGKKAEG